MSDEEMRAEVEQRLGHVLDPSGFERWWRTPIAALHNATGEQMLAAGDGDILLRYVMSYAKPTFS